MFSKMKLASKIAMGFLVLILIAVIIGIAGIRNIMLVKDADTLMYEKITSPLAELADAGILYQKMSVNLRDMLIARDHRDIKIL